MMEWGEGMNSENDGCQISSSRHVEIPLLIGHKAEYPRLGERGRGTARQLTSVCFL